MSWLPWRRRAAEPVPFQPAWRDLLDRDVAWWRELDDEERRHLEELVSLFLADKHWEAARGFELTEEVKVVVAANACLVVLGLGLDWYRDVHTIIVHRSAQTQRGERAVGTSPARTDTPRRIHGRTGRSRPIAVAWDALRREGRSPQRGRNVVHHEFAHQLDVLDGLLDGTPPLDDADERARWIEVCTAAYEEVQAGPAPPLRAYAAENPAEFFAVATEVFLNRPEELEEQRPELYEVLRRFYRQDPAARRRRTQAP